MDLKVADPNFDLNRDLRNKNIYRLAFSQFWAKPHWAGPTVFPPARTKMLALDGNPGDVGTTMLRR
jgi:hypothetical protein